MTERVQVIQLQRGMPGIVLLVVLVTTVADCMYRDDRRRNNAVRRTILLDNYNIITAGQRTKRPTDQAKQPQRQRNLS